MAKRKTNKKNRKNRKTKKMKGGIGIGDMPKVYHLYKIIKSKKSFEEKETEFIDYIDKNKKLLTDKGIGVWNGNIMHLLAEGERTKDKPEEGCIIIPWILSATSGYIKAFDDFLKEHPNIVKYIRENTSALSDIDGHGAIPLENAMICKNSIMEKVLAEPASAAPASQTASTFSISGARQRSGSLAP
jgi:hypothetical protein